MSCTIKDKMQEVIKGGAGTVHIPYIESLTDNATNVTRVYITPNSDSKKVKSTANAIEMAKTEVKRLNKLFHSDVFGTVAKIPSGIVSMPYQPNSSTARTESAIYTVQLNEKHIEYLNFLNGNTNKEKQENSVEALAEYNQYVEDVMEVLREEKSPVVSTDSEIQVFEKQRKAEQLSMEFGEDMPSGMTSMAMVKPEGLHYKKHINNKIALRDSINEKVRILDNIVNQNINDKRIIARFKDLASKLSKDIKSLETTEQSLTNFAEFFMNDISNIKKLLEIDPKNVDNLAIIDEYLQVMNNLQTPFNSNDASNPYGFLDMDLQLLKDNENIDSEEIVELFEKLKRETDNINLVLDLSKKDALLELLERNIKQTTSGLTTQEIKDQALASYEREIISTMEDISGTTQLSKTIDDVKGFALGKVLRKVYDDAVKKSESGATKQALTKVKETVEAELKKQGHRNTDGFFGALFSEANFDIFKRKTKDGTQRLVGYYNEAWSHVRENLDKKLDKIREMSFSDDGTNEFKRLVQKEKDEAYNELKDEVDFIDPSLLPEILTDPEMSAQFSEELDMGKIQEAENNKAKLVALHGQLEYDKMVTKTVKALEDYIVDLEIKADSYSGPLTAEQVAEVYLYNVEKSPFNSKYLNTTNKLKVEVVGQSVTLDLNSAIFMPKESKLPEYKDEKFQTEILSNPIFKESWEVFQKSLEFINANSSRSKDNFADSLVSQVDQKAVLLQDSKNYIHYLSRKSANYIKHITSTSKYVGSTNLKVGGSITTIDSEVKKRVKPYLSIINSNTQLYKLDAFSDTFDHLRKATGLSNQELQISKLTGKQILTKHFSDKILSTQETNLIDNLLSSVEATAIFKAKREVETTMHFIMDKINNLITDTESPRSRLIELSNFFMEGQLYGVNNRENFNLPTKKGEGGFKVFNAHETVVRKEIGELLDELKEVRDNLPKTDTKAKFEISKEIGSLEAYLESGGRVITTGSLLAVVLFRLPRFLAFFGNFVSQYKNMAFGSFAAAELNGLTFKDGSYVEARSYTRKWKKAVKSKNMTKNYQISELIINRSKIFQNSANHIFNVKDSRASNVAKRVLGNPMRLPGEVEKTIQRPQILALLSDVNTVSIKSETGVTVPVFDSKNLSNPHPAFDMENGDLVLKKEFRTPENMETWMANTSQEFADIFGDSGKIPKAIAYINGDYRESTAYIPTQSFIGSMLFMFKQWLPMLIYRKAGIYQDLIKKGKSVEASHATLQNVALYGANTGFGGQIAAATAMTIIGGITMHGKFKNRAKTQSGLQIAAEMGKYILYTSMVNNGRIGVAATAKSLQILTNLTGSNIIKDDHINSIAGFKGDAETQAQFQSLIATYSRTILLTAIRIAVTSMLFPDDEEKDKWKKLKEENLYTRLSQDPDTVLYYALENILTSLQDDLNLITSATGLIQAATPLSESRTTSKLTKAIDAISAQINEGDYKSGPNAGKNRIAIAAQRTLVPGGLSEMSLGLGSVTRKDYTPKDFLTMSLKGDQIDGPAKTPKQEDTKRWKAVRSKFKAEKLEEWKAKDPENWNPKKEAYLKKKANEMANKKYKSLAKYFDASGNYRTEKGKEAIQKRLTEWEKSD